MLSHQSTGLMEKSERKKALHEENTTGVIQFFIYTPAPDLISGQLDMPNLFSFSLKMGFNQWKRNPLHIITNYYNSAL